MEFKPSFSSRAISPLVKEMHYTPLKQDMSICPQISNGLWHLYKFSVISSLAFYKIIVLEHQKVYCLEALCSLARTLTLPTLSL